MSQADFELKAATRFEQEPCFAFFAQMGKHRLAVFASGSGTNSEEIFKHFLDHPTIEVKLLLSNNPQAYVLERAQKFAIPSVVFTRHQFLESDEVMQWLKEYRISHIALAGFLWLLPQNLIKRYPDRIINIHPALLPKYGGKGMYGMKVHEAVKSGGETQTGISIHLVNDQYDEGKILFQEKCEVKSSDTPGEIAEKVHLLEHKSYPRIIEKWISGRFI